MQKITINASDKRRLRHHLEAVWNAVTEGLSAGHIETYRFRDYAIQVRHAPDGSEMLTLEVPRPPEMLTAEVA